MDKKRITTLTENMPAANGQFCVRQVKFPFENFIVNLSFVARSKFSVENSARRKAGQTLPHIKIILQ